MGTSFYGGGCIVSGGAGGSSDYRDLVNVPVQVLKGTNVQPIIFSELDYGNYLFSGNYMYNRDSAIFIESTPTNIHVFQDETTMKKIVRLEQFENSEYFMVALIYEEDDSYTEKKFSLLLEGGMTEEIANAIDAAMDQAVVESKEYVEAVMTLNIL